MVVELVLGVWNGGKIVYSMCGHGDYFCYKHIYKVDFVVTCEIAQTKVQTHTHTHTHKHVSLKELDPNLEIMHPHKHSTNKCL